jgi:hypothetical protein
VPIAGTGLASGPPRLEAELEIEPVARRWKRPPEAGLYARAASEIGPIHQKSNFSSCPNWHVCSYKLNTCGLNTTGLITSGLNISSQNTKHNYLLQRAITGLRLNTTGLNANGLRLNTTGLNANGLILNTTGLNAVSLCNTKHNWPNAVNNWSNYNLLIITT